MNRKYLKVTELAITTDGYICKEPCTMPPPCVCSHTGPNLELEKECTLDCQAYYVLVRVSGKVQAAKAYAVWSDKEDFSHHLRQWVKPKHITFYTFVEKELKLLRSNTTLDFLIEEML